MTTMRAKVFRIAAGLLLGAFAAAPAEAKVLLTQGEALALAFGDPSRAERRTAYLTEEQIARVKAGAGTPPPGAVVVWYSGGGEPGRPLAAFFDTHLVRTLPETVMIVVGADGAVRRVEILSFEEPEDYLPRPRWFEQFQGRGLDADLATKGAIRAVTGATLSSRAVTEAVRRALALHQLLAAPPPQEARP